MQTTLETGEGLKRRLKVELPTEEVQAEIDKRMKGLAKNARIDGFRPGKVPMRVIESRFGAQVRHEAVAGLIEQSFPAAVEGEKVQIADEPTFDIHSDESDGGYGYTASFEIIPEFELQPISELQVSRVSTEIADADVDDMLEKLRKQKTEWNKVDRASQTGDTVKIDFRGVLEGESEPFQGGVSSDFPLILGSNAMIPGFEDGLTGVSADQELDLPVDFPGDYPDERLAGKKANFAIKVHEVLEPEIPDLDAEFAKEFGVDSGDLDEFRKSIEDNMDRELNRKLKGVNKTRVMDALISSYSLELPEGMVKREADSLKQGKIQELANSGQPLQFDPPVEMFTPQAERRVALGLIVGRFIDQEGLELDRDRVRAVVEEYASQYEKPDEFVQWFFTQQDQIRAVENATLEDQFVELVLEQAQVSDENMGFDDAMALQEA